jgi:hypothetical protein
MSLPPVILIVFTGGKPELAQITGGKDILTLLKNFNFVLLFFQKSHREVDSGILRSPMIPSDCELRFSQFAKSKWIMSFNKR